MVQLFSPLFVGECGFWQHKEGPSPGGSCNLKWSVSTGKVTSAISSKENARVKGEGKADGSPTLLIPIARNTEKEREGG